jgi:hypothetical protein
MKKTDKIRMGSWPVAVAVAVAVVVVVVVL